MKNTVIRALFAFLLLQIAAAFGYANGPGNLDLTFAGTGYVRGAALPLDSVKDVVIQTDGKILVLCNNNLSSLTDISRFNPDGTLDTSFGNGGRLLPGALFGVTSSSGSALLLQPDGKIIFAGNVGGGALIRLNSDGTLDTTFDGDGRAPVSYNNNGGGVLQAALRPDGKITVQGRWVDPRFGAQYDGTARFNNDGSYDTSFGINGSLVNFKYGIPFSFQPDGKVIGGSGQLRVIRYNTDDSRDASFGIDGVSQIPPLPGNAPVRAIALSSDGKVLTTGEVLWNGLNDDFAIVRYNSDGSLDTSFNGTGAVVTPVLGSNDRPSGISIQSDGKIVVCGTAQRPDNSQDIALVRYNIDGSLDTTYGSNGKVVIDLVFSEGNLSMVLDSSDRALVFGRSQTAFITRFTSAAAPVVDVGGRATSTNGQGISNATVFLINEHNERQSTLTNGFGYYIFSGVSSNETYTVFVSAKRYRFQPPTRSVTLMSSVLDLDFIGNPGSTSLVERVKSAETGVQIRLPK